MNSYTFTINGEQRTLSLPEPTPASVVNALHLNPNHVLLEQNKQILKGTATEKLTTQDPIEIIHFVGGGSTLTASVDTTTFNTSQENMDYDRHKLETHQEGERYVRFYEWKHPGITYSYKQTLPTELQRYDNAQRLTGGGIVFHEPGDLLFTCIASLNDPFFPKGLKEKMAFFSTQFKDIFTQHGLDVNASEEKGAQDITYCDQYHNPYELSYKGQKILALTIRKYRLNWICQGILNYTAYATELHLKNTSSRPN